MEFLLFLILLGYKGVPKAFTRRRLRIASRQMRAQQGIETGVFCFFVFCCTDVYEVDD
jgi:hypothetical protein